MSGPFAQACLREFARVVDRLLYASAVVAAPADAIVVHFVGVHRHERHDDRRPESRGRGRLVTAGMHIPAESLVVGVPAKIRRTVRADDVSGDPDQRGRLRRLGA